MKNEPIKEIEHKGITIEIYSDNDAQSPNHWGNDDVCFWDYRNLSVDHPEMDRDVFGAYIKQEGYEECKDEAKAMAKKYHIFGIDAYIHSGIVLSMHGGGLRCKWDTSNYIGCILVEKKEARTRAKAEKIAHGILACWNDYLSGNVYGYMLKDNITGESFGGCWGFYGDYDESGLIEEAKAEADAYIEDEQKKAIEGKIESLRAEVDLLQSKIDAIRL